MEEREFELIQKSKQGDTRAFDELVRMHDRRVLQIAYGMLGNLQDAQDVYQETFIRAFTKLATFRFESEFGTWLNRITMNLSVNRHRQRKLQQFFSIDQRKEDLEGWDLSEAENDEVTAEKRFQSKEIMQKINHCLDKLSAQQRSVFVLKHIHGYKISEIAQILNVAEGTIKNQLFRAIQKLRQNLKSYYKESLVSRFEA